MMDMGLDEIIKNKRRKASGGRKGGRLMRGKGGGGGIKRGGGSGGGRVVDARLKIIEKNRAKLRDARERLHQLARATDARSRISPRAPPHPLGRNGTLLPPRATGFPDPLPRRTIRNINAALTFSDRRDQMLYRTVKNAGNAMRGGGRGLIEDDMMEEEEDWAPGGPKLQVHLQNSSALNRPHLPTVRTESLRSNSSSEDSWLRPAPIKQTVYRGRDDVKSRLEPARSSTQPEGYRIIVSNLQPTVTHEDIKELFEDIGVLVGSRVVRPGTAEVLYKSMDDALAAVDTYHNRQLDGQPMKCMLVKPGGAAPGSKGSGKSSIVPDLHAIHKALFNK